MKLHSSLIYKIRIARKKCVPVVIARCQRSFDGKRNEKRKNKMKLRTKCIGFQLWMWTKQNEFQSKQFALRIVHGETKKIVSFCIFRYNFVWHDSISLQTGREQFAMFSFETVLFPGKQKSVIHFICLCTDCVRCKRTQNYANDHLVCCQQLKAKTINNVTLDAHNFQYLATEEDSFIRHSFLRNRKHSYSTRCFTQFS